VSREGLKQYLEENGIPSMIYYPVPGHRQKMFEAFDTTQVSLPVTDWLTERVISLPIHTEMDTDQQEFIITKVLEYIK
jgi:dTDP-4-amino-4,6-dideoxygalactose transaminase